MGDFHRTHVKPEKREDIRLSFEWATWPWNRCRAVLEPKEGHAGYWGRCDLRRKHESYHALERGFDIVMFSTAIVNAVTEY